MQENEREIIKLKGIKEDWKLIMVSRLIKLCRCMPYKIKFPINETKHLKEWFAYIDQLVIYITGTEGKQKDILPEMALFDQ